MTGLPAETTGSTLAHHKLPKLKIYSTSPIYIYKPPFYPPTAQLTKPFSAPQTQLQSKPFSAPLPPAQTSPLDNMDQGNRPSYASIRSTAASPPSGTYANILPTQWLSNRQRLPLSFSVPFFSKELYRHKPRTAVPSTMLKPR